MAFWSKLKQAKLKFHLFSYEFNRLCVSNQVQNAARQKFSYHTLIPVSNNPNLGSQSNQLMFFSKVRFYAAPIQFLVKKEEKKTGCTLNEQITAQFVRLVTDEGHSVVPTRDALAQARSLQLDLVEVDATENPPVCRIYDYKKVQSIKKKKLAENKKIRRTKGLKLGEHKEIRIAAKISPHDLKMKADTARRLMENGYRVKCIASDPTNDMDLATLLSRFLALVEDVAIQESLQVAENKQSFVIVRHNKFGPLKSGGGKAKSSKNPTSKENVDATTAGLETREAIVSKEASDEDVQTSNSEWTGFDGDDDDKVFDIQDRVGSTKNLEYGRSTVESKQANTASSAPVEAPVQNRYARDPRAVNPSKASGDMNGQRTWNKANTAPQHISHVNPSPQMRPSERFNRPPYESPQQPPPHSSNRANNVPPYPNRLNQPQFNRNAPQMGPTLNPEFPANGGHKQDSPRTSFRNSTATEFGKFSPQQADTQQNGPAVTNRYKKADPSDNLRNSSTMGPRFNRGPGGNNPEQRRWGVTPTDNSNLNADRSNEGRAEVRRQ